MVGESIKGFDDFAAHVSDKSSSLQTEWVIMWPACNNRWAMESFVSRLSVPCPYLEN